MEIRGKSGHVSGIPLALEEFLARENFNRENEAAALLHLGQSYILLGDHERASGLLCEGDRLLEGVGAPHIGLYFRCALGQLRICLDQLADARETLSEGVNGLRETGDLVGLSKNLVLLGVACLRDEDLRAAGDCLQEAVCVAGRVPSRKLAVLPSCHLATLGTTRRWALWSPSLIGVVA